MSHRLNKSLEMLNRLCVLSALIIASTVAPALPASAGTNCWAGPSNTTVSGKYKGKAISISRCDKAFFFLVPGEGSRNVRSEPTTAGTIVGKILEGSVENKFAADLIVSVDNSHTFWAYGTIMTASDSIYTRFIPAEATLTGKKGWVEIGNTDAIRQYDRPQSNDVWYRF